MKKIKYLIILIIFFIVIVKPIYAEDIMIKNSIVEEKEITNDEKKKAITLVASGVGSLIVFLGAFSITKKKNDKMFNDREKNEEEEN